MPKTYIEKTVEEFREKFSEIEKEANDFLKYKCNAEHKPRYVVVKEYGLESFENFITQALTSQAQMMVDIVEGEKNRSIQTQKETRHQRVANDASAKESVLDDILTSYKESGLIK